jgi:hypothetical protein
MRRRSLPLLALLLAACPGKGGYVRDYPAPSVADAVARLGAARDALTAFRAESTMDYWLGEDRVKGTVLVMGTAGAKVRFNALSPAGDSVMADMACDGHDFVYVDVQNNCQLAGPCSRDSIGQLLGVALEPDDFLHLALGGTPVLAAPTGTVTWDAEHGQEHLALTSAAGSQAVTIDARDKHWDVVASELKAPDGTVVWSVENAGFVQVADAAGGSHRLPTKTRFKSPGKKADLLVEWKERTVNPTLDDAKFKLEAPAGLPACGAKPAR